MSLEDLRRQYTLGGLNEAEVPDDPFVLFGEWMQTALDNNPQEWLEPYVMTLATSGPAGDVSARIVLLRGYEDGGFVFFTNYESDKGQQLAANPQAALVFYWGYLERQVRVKGLVSKVGREQSKAYFDKRPRESRVSATVSRQSEPVESRKQLEDAAADYNARNGNAPVELPDDWGGYQVVPQEIEFWQGRQNRLHDRLVYARKDSGGWQMQRLSP